MNKKMSFRFSESAEKDLENIVDYTVEEWGKRQALKYVDQLEALCEQLASNPDAGLDRTDLADKLLSFPFERHIIYYLKDRNGITIVRILHQSMDAVKHL